MDLHSNATHIVGGLRPPPGVTPNFVNPENLHKEWILSLVTCFFLPTFFILIRVYTKLIIIKSYGWEDYTVVIAWIGLIGYLAIGFVAFGNGGGIHQWNVPIEQVKIYAQAVNAKEIVNGPVIYITKLSILLQFMRIFVPHKRGAAYYFIHITIWLNLFYYLAATLVAICTCIPRRKIWEPWTPGRCLDISKVVCVSSIMNVVSDVTILMIPLFCISSLQMPLKRKIGISLVFATAIFACIASLERAVISFKIVRSQDQTYDLIPLALWSDAEIALGIMCSCMPILPKFFRHLVPKIKSRVSSYRKSKGERGSSAASGGSIVSPATAPWEMYDDSRRLQSPSPAPDIEMVGLGEQTPMDKTKTTPHGDDVKVQFEEMSGGNIIVVARDGRMDGDLEDGLRQ